jgi:hypothetical protein
MRRAVDAEARGGAQPPEASFQKKAAAAPARLEAEADAGTTLAAASTHDTKALSISQINCFYQTIGFSYRMRALFV